MQIIKILCFRICFVNFMKFLEKKFYHQTTVSLAASTPYSYHLRSLQPKFVSLKYFCSTYIHTRKYYLHIISKNFVSYSQQWRLGRLNKNQRVNLINALTNFNRMPHARGNS